MAHGKDAARDLRYGRRGGRWAAEPTPVPWHECVAVVADPTPAGLRAHLVAEHGMPADVVDQHRPDERVGWHDAEHATRHPRGRQPIHVGHLLHTHPAQVPAKAKSEAA